MRTIKILTLLLGGIFLMTSCYTQLALVEREVYQSEDYYYPPGDTIYTDGSPVIVQNFYNDVPYDFNMGMHIGFYDSWWLWSDWYYPYVGYWPHVFYPIRPIGPYWMYPGLIVYDPFYWDYYYDYWAWNRGPVYTTPYGPRPFVKDGSLLRGGGSKRVRISKTGGDDRSVGDATFLPTRTSGSLTSKSASRTSVRKTISNTDIRKTTRSTESNRTVVRKGTTERTTKKSTVIRKKTRNERKYYPITTIRSTKPKTTVKQPKATSRKMIKTQARSTNKSYGSSRSTYTNTRRSSAPRPTYSTPSRSSSHRSTSTIRSSSSRSSSRSATTTRSSSRTSKSRK
ncbi:hypothetical protein [Caldithrix abyssi]|uniref:Vitellogenin II n=1 Tax=Caldithrix abyssi DSM 13497 TaxID=880073 RepID=H1XWB6_CALAY|nr:hypothetical protein [Caldithrix abyssi]APF20822.1 Vitellogenin II precursor [Caldithrix abyssi DSM 13497]EHO40698.1 hypothetical protein Calab_1069 [Caldithrix abyssi DSM 13497]